ncbi:hypothetical protein [Pseudoroseicyclus sp. CXY001]|uniref:hypothetical protein n=1 Tax=Pseudoroseicyclus sp. CXY001 TaxID=3242492 RepID=UPI0035711EA2
MSQPGQSAAPAATLSAADKRRCRGACLGAGGAGGLLFCLILGLGPTGWGLAVAIGLGSALLLSGAFLWLFCRGAAPLGPKGSTTGIPLETSAPMGEVEAALERRDDI